MHTHYGLCSARGEKKIYKIIILLAILHGCETWSLILREERKLRVFEVRVLTIIFGLKREKEREE